MASPEPATLTPDQALALLQWQIEMGADEAIGAEAVDHFAPAPLSPPPALRATSPIMGEASLTRSPSMAEDRAGVTSAPTSPRPAPSRANSAAAAPPRALTESAAEPAQSARALAAQVDSIAALAAIIAGFDACPLKRT